MTLPKMKKTKIKEKVGSHQEDPIESTEVKQPRIQHLLGSLPSRRTLILCHEILGKPKGLI